MCQAEQLADRTGASMQAGVRLGLNELTHLVAADTLASSCD
jgi:hypothetical protein